MIGPPGGRIPGRAFAGCIRRGLGNILRGSTQHFAARLRYMTMLLSSIASQDPLEMVPKLIGFVFELFEVLPRGFGHALNGDILAAASVAASSSQASNVTYCKPDRQSVAFDLEQT